MTFRVHQYKHTLIVKVIVIVILSCNVVHNKLISVLQINRHGARTPGKITPSLQLSNYTNDFIALYGNNMKLTPNGLAQCKILGQYMKEKYVDKEHFISDNYNKDEVKFMSTPTQRTIYSLEGFLNGLYPNAIPIVMYNEPTFKDVLYLDTIPVNDKPHDIIRVPLYVLSNKENQMFYTKLCKLDDTVLNDEDFDLTLHPNIFNITFSELKSTLNDIIKHINILSNKDISIDDELISDNNSNSNKFTSESISDIIKLVIVHLYHHGIDLDNSSMLSKTSIQTIRKIILNKWYSSRLKDNKKLKLEISELFNTVLTHFKNAISSQRSSFLKSKKYTKYVVYSAHDSAIVSVLANILNESELQELLYNAVGNKRDYEFLVPPYASHVLFELHKDEEDNSYYVKIIYNGKEIKNKLKENVRSSNEGDGIEYNEFKKLINSRIDKDYKKLSCPKANKKNKGRNIVAERIKNVIDDYYFEQKLGEEVPLL